MMRKVWKTICIRQRIEYEMVNAMTMPFWQPVSTQKRPPALEKTASQPTNATVERLSALDKEAMGVEKGAAGGHRCRQLLLMWRRILLCKIRWEVSHERVEKASEEHLTVRRLCQDLLP
jgi:hypothetical protein